MPEDVRHKGYFQFTFKSDRTGSEDLFDEEITATIEELMSGGLSWTDFLDNVQIDSVVFVPDEVK